MWQPPLVIVAVAINASHGGATEGTLTGARQRQSMLKSLEENG